MTMCCFSELALIGLILLLPFLYETSPAFRYYLKFLVYYLVVSFNSIILIPVFAFRPCDVKNLLVASKFCRPVSALLSLKWQIRGKEHLEKDESCIIVANHQSALDVLGMFDLWPIMNRCTVVAKRELYYAWPFGLAAWLSGLIFIDRMQTDKARNALYDAGEIVKQQRTKLWIFPEGTRRNTGDLHPFKKGAFHMAIDAQLPIQPVVFSSYITFLDDKKKIFAPAKIIVTALPPISTIGLTKDDLDSLMSRTHEIMRAEYKVTSAEVMANQKPKQLPQSTNTPNDTVPSYLSNPDTTQPQPAQQDSTVPNSVSPIRIK